MQFSYYKGDLSDQCLILDWKTAVHIPVHRCCRDRSQQPGVIALTAVRAKDQSASWDGLNLFKKSFRRTKIPKTPPCCVLNRVSYLTSVLSSV